MKQPGASLIIGIGKPKGGPPPPPPGMKDAPGMSDMKSDATDDTGDETGDDSGKKSPEEALVVRAGQDCDDCKNYQADTGECAKVSGQFSPEDSCLRYFEAKDDGSNDDMPDSDDSTPPDDDSDSSGYGQPS